MPICQSSERYREEGAEICFLGCEEWAALAPEPVSLSTFPCAVFGQPVPAWDTTGAVVLVSWEGFEGEEDRESTGDVSIAERLHTSLFHHTGNSSTEISMLLAMPTAQTVPRLARPALLEKLNEANPVIDVSAHNSNARPVDRHIAWKSLPCRRRPRIMKML